MTEPTQNYMQPYQAQNMPTQAGAHSRNFRARSTPKGDLIDIILDLEKRLERLEATINTH
jgi:hypothetical protein